MTQSVQQDAAVHPLVPRHLEGRLTISVPEAGGLLGLSRNSSYDAARRGEIPTLKVGKRLLVPVARLLELVGVAPARAGAGTASPNAETVQPLVQVGGGPQHAA